METSAKTAANVEDVSVYMLTLQFILTFEERIVRHIHVLLLMGVCIPVVASFPGFIAITAWEQCHDKVSE